MQQLSFITLITFVFTFASCSTSMYRFTPVMHTFQTPVFEVLWDPDEENIFVGARNHLLKFDSNLTILQDLQTGPELDNYNCPPSPLKCNVTRVPTDNDIKVLLFYDQHEMLMCGTMNQGVCHIYRNFDIIKQRALAVGHIFETKSFIASRDTVVAFYGKRAAPSEDSPSDQKALFSASSYDGRPKQLSEFTISSKIMTLANKKLVFEYSYETDRVQTALDFHSGYKFGGNLKFINGFVHEGFAYFLSTQSLQSGVFETRLGRVCESDPTFLSYSEVPLRCMRESGAYNLATAAYVGEISKILRSARNLDNTETQVLYVIFANASSDGEPQERYGSLLCMFPMSQIDTYFVNATRDCFNGELKMYRLKSLTGTEDKCVKRPLKGRSALEEALCAPGINHYVEGRDQVPGGLRATIAELGTSLAVTLQNKATVAFVGTKSGNVLKYILERNEDQKPLYNISVVGDDRNGTEKNNSLYIRRSNAFDEFKENLYLLTGNKVIKFPVSSCNPYPDCHSCHNAGEPLGCGWCGDRCAHKEECFGELKKSFCPPYIFTIWPETGPEKGGTLLTIEGDNFSSNSSGAKLVVRVNGVPCDIVGWHYKRIQCRTNEVANKFTGIVFLSVNDTSFEHELDISGAAESEQTFSYLKPKLKGIFPGYGPKSGGTNVTVVGKYLDIGFIQSVKLAGQECKIYSNNGTHIQCTSGAYVVESVQKDSAPLSGSVIVWIDGNGFAPIFGITCPDCKIYKDSFQYRNDPIVEDIKPNVTSFSGGTEMVISGKYLDSVAHPFLVVTITQALTGDQKDIIQPCFFQETPAGNRLICSTPSLVNETLEAEPTAMAPLRTHVSFIMDGVADLRRFSHDRLQLSQLFYYPDPAFHQFPGNVSQVRTDTLELFIKGKNLNLAFLPEDIKIIVNGSMRCNVQEVSFDVLRCSLSHHNATLLRRVGGKNPFPVTVRAGNLAFSLGGIILVDPPEGLSARAVAGITLSILFVLVVILIFLYRKGYLKRLLWKQEHGLNYAVAYSQDPDRPPRNDYQDYPNGHAPHAPGEACSSKACNAPVVDEEMMHLLNVDNILFAREYLTLGEEIGQGHFGQVCKGELQLPGKEGTREVAVKTLSSSRYQDTESVHNFLQEGLMMKDFHHHHVLTLIGVCFEDGLPMVILPFMENGDLRSYIQNESNEPTIKLLIEFGIQIAEGMKYLAEIKFVHRDLAARNCMLDTDLTVKVADFGLSRDVYEREYYSSDNKKSKLPVKWMAPESMEKGTYSSKTDVWSFGVVLWELMTRGVTPYPEVVNWEILQYIKEGRRMPQPSYCPNILYRIMVRCWNEDPRQRPTFSELVTEIKALIKKMENRHKDRPVGLKVTYVNIPQADGTFLDV